MRGKFGITNHVKMQVSEYDLALFQDKALSDQKAGDYPSKEKCGAIDHYLSLWIYSFDHDWMKREWKIQFPNYSRFYPEYYDNYKDEEFGDYVRIKDQVNEYVIRIEKHAPGIYQPRGPDVALSDDKEDYNPTCTLTMEKTFQKFRTRFKIQDGKVYLFKVYVWF